MKEITFINRNKKRWDAFEKQLNTVANPDDLADQYIQLTDDLSFARTFYPKSRITSYLNRLTLKTHQEIYKNKREKSGRIKTFWIEELPLVLRETRPSFLLALVIFLVAGMIGTVSALTDDTFVRLILSDQYVNHTLNNIQSGNPMGIYGDSEEIPMFLMIVFNNVKVAFFAFVLGLLTHFGTSYFLVYNGIMVGSFITFFYQKNLLSVSVLAIMIHGSLELSAITLAGGAGFVLGNGMLFPKSFPRLHSFQQAARKGAKIMISLVVVFTVAGFLESFVTRHYKTIPLLLNLIIILGSLTFIIWYYFIYPERVYRKINRSSNTILHEQ